MSTGVPSLARKRDRERDLSLASEMDSDTGGMFTCRAYVQRSSAVAGRPCCLSRKRQGSVIPARNEPGRTAAVSKSSVSILLSRELVVSQSEASWEALRPRGIVFDMAASCHSSPPHLCYLAYLIFGGMYRGQWPTLPTICRRLSSRLFSSFYDVKARCIFLAQ